MSSKFLKGVFLGALIGGAVSLFDKDTRRDMALKGRKLGQAIKNPKQTSQMIKEKATEIQQAYEQIRNDLTYISDKLYELKDVPPKVTDIITESKKVIEGPGQSTNDSK